METEDSNRQFEIIILLDHTHSPLLTYLSLMEFPPLINWTSPFPILGAQWLSVRVLDSRQRDRGFEPHRRHCVVSLSKTHLSLLSTGSTQEDPSRHN